MPGNPKVIMLYVLITVIALLVLNRSLLEGGDMDNPSLKSGVELNYENPWRKEVNLWGRPFYVGDASLYGITEVWKQHDGLRQWLHKNHTDVVKVLFMDSAKVEPLWVQILDYHKTSDLYLGVLVAEPGVLNCIKPGDNVVFRVTEFPIAVNLGNGFRYSGLPQMSPPTFLKKMADALNNYRQGNFGHNMEYIEKAIEEFKQASKFVSKETDSHSLFFMHFYLARCYAEKYETVKAIKHFKEALKIRPYDVDTSMTLLEKPPRASLLRPAFQWPH